MRCALHACYILRSLTVMLIFLGAACHFLLDWPWAATLTQVAVSELRRSPGSSAWIASELASQRSKRSAVVGNALQAIHVANVSDLYLFNTVDNIADGLRFACPARIHHYHNHLARAKVLETHKQLRRMCPESLLKLRMVHQKSQQLGLPLPRREHACFSRLPNDGHPWSIGFFVLSRLVQRHLDRRGDTHPPLVYGFTHRVSGSHPGRCEKGAVDAWSRRGQLVDLRTLTWRERW
jgi:hypothetical protein